MTRMTYCFVFPCLDRIYEILYQWLQAVFSEFHVKCDNVLSKIVSLHSLSALLFLGI